MGEARIGSQHVPREEHSAVVRVEGGEAARGGGAHGVPLLDRGEPRMRMDGDRGSAEKPTYASRPDPRRFSALFVGQ